MKISVVIPCFNAEATVARAVDSVLANKPHVKQIILVDNNSTDDTQIECERLVALHDGIVSLSFESTKGACGARNNGLELVDAEWVQFLDADDTIFPTKLIKQAKFGNRNNLDVVVSPYFRVNGNGEKSNSLNPELPTELGLVRATMGITGSILFRSKALKAIGGWNNEWSSSQEYELMFRLFLDGSKFGVLNERLMNYSVGVEGSISTGNNRKRRTNSLNLRWAMLDKFIKPEMDPILLQKLYNGFFLQIRWTYFENRKLAEEAWKFLRSLGYFPSKDTYIPTVYCWFLWVFGLRFTEEVRRFFQSIRKL